MEPIRGFRRSSSLGTRAAIKPAREARAFWEPFLQKESRSEHAHPPIPHESLAPRRLPSPGMYFDAVNLTLLVSCVCGAVAAVNVSAREARDGRRAIGERAHARGCRTLGEHAPAAALLRPPHLAQRRRLPTAVPAPRLSCSCRCCASSAATWRRRRRRRPRRRPGGEHASRHFRAPAARRAASAPAARVGGTRGVVMGRGRGGAMPRCACQRGDVSTVHWWITSGPR